MLTIRKETISHDIPFQSVYVESEFNPREKKRRKCSGQSVCVFVCLSICMTLFTPTLIARFIIPSILMFSLLFRRTSLENLLMVPHESVKSQNHDSQIAQHGCLDHMMVSSQLPFATQSKTKRSLTFIAVNTNFPFSQKERSRTRGTNINDESECFWIATLATKHQRAHQRRKMANCRVQQSF